MIITIIVIITITTSQMVKPKMRAFQSQLVGFRDRQHLMRFLLFLLLHSSEPTTVAGGWEDEIGIWGWNYWRGDLHFLCVPNIWRHLDLDPWGKWAVVQIFWATLGLKPGQHQFSWSRWCWWRCCSLSLTHPPIPSSRLLTAHSLFLPSTQHSVLPNTVLPTSVAHCVAQCCPPNTVNHPKTLFQVNHRQRFKITILVSKLPLRDCLSTKSGSHNFFYVHQVSRQSDNSPRTRLTLKNLCVFPQQVFPVYF